MTDTELQRWLAGRKEAAKLIDVATCEITGCYGQILDPYGVLELTPEERCVGKNLFVRSPDSGGWVSISDLPEESSRALHERIEREREENRERMIVCSEN
jgi:hypothetical protein